MRAIGLGLAFAGAEPEAAEPAAAEPGDADLEPGAAERGVIHYGALGRVRLAAASRRSAAADRIGG